ncbi:MAG: cytochrome c3 family protein [Verrucomicrobiae bacterium]|nr:cytochrome c3 family protein [Verrucomicrobiae bacterium]MCP5540111.1 cytochrome c3 family protein [Akkermansiaceae bacterium]
MGNPFPRWTNWLPVQIVICLGALGTVVTAWVWYTWTPKYTRVGYQPNQPIPFDHTIHAGQVGMDCRYCHSFVENSAHSNVPNAQVCWNCHGPGKVKSDSPKLEPLRQAMDTSNSNYTGAPIRWVQIHETPDYAYFNHSAHVNRGVSCVECHGKVNEMPVVYHAKPLSMGFCLDCHRNVESHLRPLDEITNLDWEAHDLDKDQFYAYLAEKTGKPADDLKEADKNKELNARLVGARLKEMMNVNPPQDCAACHR